MDDPTRVHGPMAEYDARVESGRLRDDEHQRGTKAKKETKLGRERLTKL